MLPVTSYVAPSSSSSSSSSGSVLPSVQHAHIPIGDIKAMRRLSSSWRVYETIAGRMIKILIIRDSNTQKVLFVFRYFCDRSTKWKRLGVNTPLRQTLVSGSNRSSLSSGEKVNRGRIGRNLRPGFRSKLRLRVRHRERVHSEGRWHPLWRSYAEEADLKRTQYILEAEFGCCKDGFLALLKDSLHHAR